MSMKYVLISEDTLRDYKLNQEHSLNLKDLQVISTYKEVLSKFILQRAYSIQTELGQGQKQGKEALSYEVMSELSKIAHDILDSDGALKDYEEKLKVKEEKENNLK